MGTKAAFESRESQEDRVLMERERDWILMF